MERTNHLTHHGIKGMKWGIRRFQNKDGSLTKAGRKRYGDGEEFKKKSEKSKDSKPKRKPISEMTDEELDKAIARARKEDEYRRLRPEQVSAGKKFADTVINKMVVPAATEAGKNFLTKSLNKMGDNLLKDTVDPDSYEALKKAYDKLKVKDDINQLKRKTDKENVKLDDKQYKLDLQKRISDLENPKQDVQKEAQRLQNELNIKKLSDPDYVDSMIKADKAKWNKAIDAYEEAKRTGDPKDVKKAEEAIKELEEEKNKQTAV